MGQEISDVQIVIDLITKRDDRLTSSDQWEARAELAYVKGALNMLMKWAKQREARQRKVEMVTNYGN